MDIAEQVQHRVREASSLTASHPRPWLVHLHGLPRVREALCERTATAASDSSLLRSVCLARRLKPDAEPRDFAFVTLELELAIMAQASDLVWELDGASRRRFSFSTPVSFGAAPYWSLQPFPEQGLPGGAFRRYRSARTAIRRGAPFVASTDVRRFFPSLSWAAIVGGVTYACGWSRRDVKQAIGLLGAVRMALQGRHSGLPIGLELSSVLGNAVLAEVDDVVEGLAYNGLAVRWMDDIAVGVFSADAGRDVLARIAEGPLRVLNLHLHPAKTEVAPTWAWTPTRASTLHVDDGELPVDLWVKAFEATSAQAGKPLRRTEARSLIRALQARELDPEHEAEVLADHAAELVLGMPDLGKRVRALVGARPPASITDRLLASWTATPHNSAWEGEAADELVLHLAVWGADVGPTGRTHLRTFIADRSRSERARVAAGWVLARRAGDHDPAVLERLNEMSVPAARGAVGAAHLAGARLTNFHYRQASLVPD